MTETLINSKLLENFNRNAFESKEPFPFVDFKDFLTPQAFQTLHNEFPGLEFFEYHDGIYRGAQRPHNRYYLAYESSIYHKKDQEAGAGIIKYQQLSPTWKKFMDELEGKVYQQFLSNLFKNTKFHLRYAWHIGKSSNEVSPHRDSPSKLGTHIFYFNTNEDWNKAWGGDLLILGEKKVESNAPEFSDFGYSISINNMDNHSFLFKNTPDAWHGVRPLSCPENHFRRLFNVILQAPSPS